MLLRGTTRDKRVAVSVLVSRSHFVKERPPKMSSNVEQALRIARLRKALQKIADLPLTPILRGRAERRNKDLRVRRIAIAALKQ